MKYLQLPKTLRSQFIFLCASMTLIFGVIFGLGFMWLVSSVECRLMGSVMKSDIESAVFYDISRGEAPRVDQFSRLYIEGDKVRDVPERFKSLKEGYSEYLDGEDLHVYKETIDGKVYVLTRQQGEFETWEQGLFTHMALLFTALIALLVSLSVFIANRAARPAQKLVRESEAMARDLESGRMYSESVLAGPWPENEIGILAHRVRALALRQRRLLLNEKQFVSEVSHELRTPLTVLSTSLELLGLSKNLTEREQGTVRRASETVTRMGAMIRVFLSVLRNDGFDKAQSAELKDIIDDLLPVWERSAEEKGLALTVSVNQKTPRRYNEVLASSVINNLVVNALRYTEKGSVTVEADDRRIRISDTGSGISEDEREKIFDEGYRGRQARSQGGFGIELSVAGRCCDALGWTLSLESENGRGTTFILEI